MLSPAVGGLLKSDLRFNKLLTWNTFPLPHTDAATRQSIIQAGAAVLRAREIRPDLSLADLYNPASMSTELINAHQALDREIDRLFGVTSESPTMLERQEHLFSRYRELTSPLLAAASNARRRR